MTLCKEFLVLPKGASQVQKMNQTTFEKLTGVLYAPTLIFASDSLRTEVSEVVQSYKEQISMEHYWMGILYSQAIHEGWIYPDLIVGWVHDQVGYGVFAGREMPEGEWVGVYSGEVRRRNLQESVNNDYCFAYEVGDFKTPFQIDARRKGGLMRYMNHSAKPNVKTIPVLSQGLLHIVFLTTEPILQGKELTIDYGFRYWEMKGESPRPSLYSLNPEQFHFKD